MDQPPGSGSQVVAWRPPVAGVGEVLHARLVGFAYPPHCHDRWTVLLVDGGAVRYDLDRRQRDGGRRTVHVLPPGVMHDGRPGPAGMTKRVLYLDETWLADRLVGRAVDVGPLADPDLAGCLADAHRHLAAGDPMAAESAVAVGAERISAHLARHPAAPPPPERAVARRLRRHLDETPLSEVRLVDAAAALYRSVAHLVRSFRAAYGLPPHAYLTGRRIDAARTRLLDGVPPAQVAAEVGFVDQAHLTRHFRRHTGITPAAFGAGSRRAARPPAGPVPA
ncbi:MAG: AraC family transcriptional regulator [Acidimicrobiales bacterium]